MKLMRCFCCVLTTAILCVLLCACDAGTQKMTTTKHKSDKQKESETRDNDGSDRIESAGESDFSGNDITIQTYIDQYNAYLTLNHPEGEFYALYRDLTHDGYPNLLLYSITEEDGFNHYEVDVFDYKDGIVSVDHVYKIYDNQGYDIHVGGFIDVYLYEQGGQYYLLEDDSGMWQGFGRKGYNLFYLNGSVNHEVRGDNYVLLAYNYYETPDTPDSTPEELDRIWNEYAPLYDQIDSEFLNYANQSTVIVDSERGRYYSGENEYVYTQGSSISESYATIDITTNYGSSQANAEKRGFRYITQTHYNYDDNNPDNNLLTTEEWGRWKEATYTYKGNTYRYRDSACPLCCKTMILSHFNVINPDTQKQYTMEDVFNYNGGKLEHESIDPLYKNNGISRYNDSEYNLPVYNKSAKDEQTLHNRNEVYGRVLDRYLDLYSTNPERYSPVMLSIDMMTSDGVSSHFILVVGKDSDGTYICIDPNLKRFTKFMPIDNETPSSINDNTYQSPIKGLFFFEKK